MENNDKCAYPKCGKELIHTQGRKKKKYCNSECRLLDWQANNPKPKKREPVFKVPLNKLSEDKVYSWKNGELKEIKYTPTTPASFDGAKVDTKGKDEHGQWQEPKDNSQLITQYEEELSKLGSGELAKMRRKWLENKIKELNQ